MSILLGYIKNKKGFWPEKHTHNVADVLQKKKYIQFVTPKIKRRWT